MATKFVIPQRSAHPDRIKKSTLIQEGVRRLLNVSPDLPDEERARVMMEYDLKLRYSGYNKAYRWNTIKAAYGIYGDKVTADKEGKRPMYRHREFLRRERERGKRSNRETWYQGGGPIKDKAPLIIDPTPDGKMAKEMASVIQDFKSTHNIGVKLVQRGGSRIVNLASTDPLGNKACTRENCPICTGEAPGRCDRAGVGYRQTCDCCKSQGITATYEGETSRTAFCRGMEHKKDIEKKDLESPLWKHCSIHHQETAVPFTMEVTGIYKSAGNRLSNKIVRIRSSNSNIVLNSKNDWAQPAMIRVVPTMGNIMETQEGDQQPTRQQRRAARATADTQGASPSGTATPIVRRRNRRANLVATTPLIARNLTQPAAETDDRETRRQRREQTRSSQP
jgi:hypothetical protein